MRARLAVFSGLGIAAAVAVYLAGLATGMVSAVAYASGSERQQGFSSTSWFPIRIGTPTVWLATGSALQADFEVDATFGALSLTVAPPLLLRTPLQAATAYVAGKRTGRVLFVAQTPGWYTVRTQTTPIGGPRCPRERNLGETLIGSSDCPTYDVSYRVVWRLAEPGRAAPDTARLNVPLPNGKLVTKYFRD